MIIWQKKTCTHYALHKKWNDVRFDGWISWNASDLHIASDGFKQIAAIKDIDEQNTLDTQVVSVVLTVWRADIIQSVFADSKWKVEHFRLCVWKLLQQFWSHITLLQRLDIAMWNYILQL